LVNLRMAVVPSRATLLGHEEQWMLLANSAGPETRGIETATGLTGVTSPDLAQGFCPDQTRA